MSGRDVTQHKKWSFPLRISKISWTHHALSFRWSASETKRWNLGLTLRPPHVNKTGNLQSSHLTTLQSFLPCHLPTPPSTHLSQIATSLLSHLSDCDTSLFSHLSHLATLLHSYTFPAFPAPYSPILPSSLPTTIKSLQNGNVLSLGRQGKHVWLIVR